MEFKGIDVSKWNGTIDWQKVKGSGIDFAIIREGFGVKSPNQIDEKFKYNITGAKNAGISCGAYHYSYAVSVQEAVNEAQFCLENIRGYQLAYPIAFDAEDKIMLKLSTRQRTDICKAFCEEMEKNGYYTMIYCNLNWLETFIKNTVRPSTYRGYEALIRKHIVPSIGHHKIFELNLPILQEFFNSKKRTSVNDKSPAKLSEKTIKNMRNIHTLSTL